MHEIRAAYMYIAKKVELCMYEQACTNGENGDCACMIHRIYTCTMGKKAGCTCI